MADYIYLLENRLSRAQQTALQSVREVARSQRVTVFLVGGAVRDLTSGSPVRDLDVAVQGNALTLRREIESSGGVVTGESKAGQALFVRFPGGVRVEIGSTLSVTYPKPGKPVVTPATILDDLRRRDFTANAMALSLNDGSYGLLMDPLNGVADIENRQLRLVSNYGFIEDPVRMIRAARFSARLGWTMDEKTQVRYENGKQENSIDALGDYHRGYEAEEIFHEEDPLRILRRLEEEGWMKHLFPAMTIAKANATELEKLREVQTQLQMRGIQPEAAAANFPLLTAKLSAAEIADLKRSFVRPGFVAEVESLESEAKEFAAQLSGKLAGAPSQAWKLLVSAKPEAVLWVAYSSKSPSIQAKLKSYYTEWPQARNKIPYTVMQEMRIVPELPGYDDLVEKLFFELMDGRLGTVEEIKAYLESYSPPAPPPPVHLRRPRAAKKDAKGTKGRKKAAAAMPDSVEQEEDGGTQSSPNVTEEVEGAAEVLDSTVKADPVRSAPVAEAASAQPQAPRPVPKKAVAVRAATASPKTLPVKSAPKKVTPPVPVHKAAPAQKVAAKAPAKVAGKHGNVVSKAVHPAKKMAAVRQGRKSAPAKKAAVKSAAKAPVKTGRKIPAKTATAKKVVPVKKTSHGKKVVKAATAKKR